MKKSTSASGGPSATTPSSGGGGPRTLAAGAMIMRGVTLFLASGRRASEARRRAEAHARKASSARNVVAQMDAGARDANKLQPKQIEALRRRTHFSKNELEALYQMYRKLIAAALPARKVAMAIKASGTGISKSNVSIDGIDRTMFKEILHATFDLVAEETLAERIWSVWEGGGAPQSSTTTTTASAQGGGASAGGGGGGASSSGALRLETWLCGLSTFVKGTLGERLLYCFRVYDLNSDGYIAREEMFALLRNSLLKQPGDEDPDEGVRELVELALKKMDVDQDGRISFEDYRQSVLKEPLLMEAFGQVLPGNNECLAFLESLQ